MSDDYREKPTEKGLARRAAGRTVRAGLDQPEHSQVTDRCKDGGGSVQGASIK